jgi:hypothetical protein
MGSRLGIMIVIYSSHSWRQTTETSGRCITLTRQIPQDVLRSETTRTVTLFAIVPLTSTQSFTTDLPFVVRCTTLLGDVFSSPNPPCCVSHVHAGPGIQPATQNSTVPAERGGVNKTIVHSPPEHVSAINQPTNQPTN